jgi:hypothetical protein
VFPGDSVGFDEWGELVVARAVHRRRQFDGAVERSGDEDGAVS